VLERGGVDESGRVNGGGRLDSVLVYLELGGCWVGLSACCFGGDNMLVGGWVGNFWWFALNELLRKAMFGIGFDFEGFVIVQEMQRDLLKS